MFKGNPHAGQSAASFHLTATIPQGLIWQNDVVKSVFLCYDILIEIGCYIFIRFKEVLTMAKDIENVKAKESTAKEKEVKSQRILRQVSEYGQVIIADQVFAIIAGIAAMEVEGVSSMADGITRELIAKLGIKNLSKGVKVEVADEKISVYMALNIAFGYNIPSVCYKVQDRVKAMIENMTGLQVIDVNVKVAGVVTA